MSIPHPIQYANISGNPVQSLQYQGDLAGRQNSVTNIKTLSYSKGD